MRKAILTSMTLLNPLLPWQIVSEHWNVFHHMLKRQFTQRYQASAFGRVWSIIQPLFMLVVYTYVFREVFKVRWGNEADTSNSMFAITMFCGMAFFIIFSEALNQSCGIVTGNVNFVKKVVFPLELLPLIQLINSALLGAIWFIVILVANFFFGGLDAYTWALTAFLPVMAGFLLFTGGICFLVASLGVFFRDMQFLLGMVLQVLFFITPIFYPASAVPERYRWVLNCNPLSLYVDHARNSLLYGLWPSWESLVLMLILGLIFFQLGFAWFMITKRGFADVI